uniref:Uncharacterized protein n=1 Tax=Salix viminalis TaxID=40686 RepID=A0A6N2MZF6_SALVM
MYTSVTSSHSSNFSSLSTGSFSSESTNIGHFAIVIFTQEGRQIGNLPRNMGQFHKVSSERLGNSSSSTPAEDHQDSHSRISSNFKITLFIAA